MRDKLDKALHGKLHGYSEQPSDAVWQRIMRDLPGAGGMLAGDGAPVAGGKAGGAAGGGSRRRLWLRATPYAAAACLLCALVLTGVLWRQGGPSGMDGQTAAFVPGVGAASFVRLASPAEDGSPLPAAVLAEVRTLRVSQPVIRFVEPDKEPVVSVAGGDDGPGRVIDIDPESAGTAPKEPQAAAGTEQRKPLYRTQYGDFRPYDDSQPVVRRRRTQGLSATLYAANFTGSNTGNPANASSSPETYRLMEVVSRGANATQVYTAPAVKEVKHRLPLCFGAGVSFGVSPRLGIETGLTYSLLRSDWEADGHMSSYSTRQELHYLGVPVALIWRAADLEVVSLYLRGGGMLEKGVSGKRTTRMNTSGVNDVTTLKMNGLQPSLSAAAGMELRLGRTLGIYVEPGINYYPSQQDQPESYRTANPVTFGLKAGLRINLR